jgi:hypothetical protein
MHAFAIALFLWACSVLVREATRRNNQSNREPEPQQPPPPRKGRPVLRVVEGSRDVNPARETKRYD